MMFEKHENIQSKENSIPAMLSGPSTSFERKDNFPDSM